MWCQFCFVSVQWSHTSLMSPLCLLWPHFHSLFILLACYCTPHLAVILDTIYINCTIYTQYIINPFQSNFSANRILPSSYLLWAGKRLVDYLLAKVRTTWGKVSDRLLKRRGRTNAKKSVEQAPTVEQANKHKKKKVSDVTRHRSGKGKIIMSDEVRRRIGKV